MTAIISLPRFVIDASVVVKWHLLDEQDLDVAERLLQDYRTGRIRLIAPDHLRYEVPSAIRKALRTRRLALDDAHEAIERFFNWHIPTVADDDLILAGFDQSIRFGCSLYDGLYLALAENSGCPLIYADRRLGNALAGQFPLALWLRDYQPTAER